MSVQLQQMFLSTLLGQNQFLLIFIFNKGHCFPWWLSTVFPNQGFQGSISQRLKLGRDETAFNEGRPTGRRPTWRQNADMKAFSSLSLFFMKAFSSLFYYFAFIGDRRSVTYLKVTDKVTDDMMAKSKKIADGRHEGKITDMKAFSSLFGVGRPTPSYNRWPTGVTDTC